MSLIMLLKIFSDCSIILALISLLPVQFHFPLLLCALVCGIAACLATFLEEKNHYFLRRLCAVLPLGCLLLTQGGLELALTLIPVGYTVITILWGKQELEYSRYTHFFVRTLWLLGGVWVVCSWWNSMMAAFNAGETIMRLNTPSLLRYGLIHALCGVVVQRRLRLCMNGRVVDGRGQVFTLMGTAGLIAGTFLLSEPVLRQGVVEVMRGITMAVVAGMMWLLHQIDRLLTLLRNKDAMKPLEDLTSEQREQQFDIIQKEWPSAKPRDIFDGVDMNTVVTVVLGLILVVAVALMVFSFGKRRTQVEVGEQIERIKPAAKKKKTTSRSNRGKVRQYYRDFLRLEKNLGMKIKNSDTSHDVLSRIDANTDQASAEALRQVYLSARYDDRCKVSNHQVEEAKRALKGAQNSHKGVRV